MPEEINRSRLTDENALRQVLEQYERVVVEFRADWSDRCQQLESELSDFPGTHLAVVDVDDCPLLAYRYDVNRIPTLLRFEDGDVVDRREGVPDDVDAFLGAELV